MYTLTEDDLTKHEVIIVQQLVNPQHFLHVSPHSKFSTLSQSLLRVLAVCPTRVTYNNCIKI